MNSIVDSRTNVDAPPTKHVMVVFEHEKLEVYKIAVEYSDAADRIAAALQPGHAHVREQLRTASDSIVNNIAEGAGEFSAAENARFYRIALRSGTESAASLHTCQRRSLADPGELEAARALLKRVVEMLTRLILSVSKR
jgi:four helix bundle protein